MLVQERSSSKDPSKTYRHRLQEAKSLDFSTWVAENVYRIVAVGFIVASLGAVFLFRNFGSTAALIRLESKTQSLRDSITYPEIDFKSVSQIADRTSPYASFRMERWIVVSVSDYPSESLLRLSKIKGWQLLAIGNSHTPSDWNLKGTIFLSLEQQAGLGFRIIDHLPYNSYVRKSVGYLFAIQHGAKKIFDADDRVEVIGDDLGWHFDVELVGEGARRETVLQYSHENPNRTVVNPYIHFGQRSVWPRGLPLENVGEVGHEEFYTEIYNGKQFIQQGLSNGLPDVDSVFYFTRKSGLEPFDIRFDDDAPKVALPQGMMVPVNSFNTLFHSSAFWGLMLPVSVTRMASDVIRGYWAQRILWEIGGLVVVYPPTVRRADLIKSYPFSEEKDLHVNVGRLIKFLIFWRSRKTTLFERILHLSYSMAEEGFWTAQDVKFTADWLQDLVAVGYQQPRLMALELDRPRAAIGHGDRREFIPQKLPTMHLGVEEIGTVGYEIGNLIRWRRNFGNVVLIMFCSRPVERTALEWRLLYGRIFKTVVILSEKNSSDLVVEHGQLWQAYKYLPKVFRHFPGAEGYLYLQDDAVLNYWNLLQADKTKLWITDKVPESWMTINIEPNTWFSKQAELVERVINLLPAHFQVGYKERVADNTMVYCTSEIFYIPQRFVGDFSDLVGIVDNLDIHHKIAVPMFFMAIDSPLNFDSDALGSMIYRADLQSNASLSIYSALAPAVYPCNVTDESSFIKLIRSMATGDPLLMEMV